MDLKARLEQEFLPFVIKPARYLGNEFNTVQKKLTDVELRIALCSLSIYEKGITDLSFEILYYTLNNQATIWCERFFLPSQDACNILKEKNIPLFSLESKSALNEFDVVIFTLHSELQCTGLIKMLRLGSLPLRNVNREDTFPIIFGCGESNWNPEPVADFLDVLVIGNWQSQMLDIIRMALSSIKENETKKELKNHLSKLKGVYLPDRYQPIYNDVGEFINLEKLDESLPGSIEFAKYAGEEANKSYSIDPLFSIVRPDFSNDDEVLTTDTFTKVTENNFEINSQFQSQFRQQNSPQAEVLLFLDGKAGSIWNEIKERIFFHNQKLKFSLPDFKIEDNELQLKEFSFFNKHEACIFAVAGSLRLRTLINHHYRDEDLYRLLYFLIGEEFSKIKLIFLIGLPTEKNEDITQLSEVIKNCAEIINSMKDVQLIVHVSPFIPRPFSIFQWEGMENGQKLKEKYDILQQNLAGLEKNLIFEDIQKSMLKTILGRGNRSLSHILEAVSESVDMHSEDEFDFTVWESILNTKKEKWEKYLEPISVTEPLPWDHIDYGISKYQLKSDRLNALQGKIDSTISKTVRLGRGIPRDQFENLMKTGKAEVTKEKTEPIQPNLIVEQTEEIQFGRQVRRQIKQSTPIKKKIRVHYTKIGSARFFSHLDVARIFEITARKAAVSLVYTQGKSPHPKFSFGPPLPVGITSIAEYLDVEIEMKDDTEIQSKLNSVFPDGIQIVQYKILFAKVPALSAVINLADYKINWTNQKVSNQMVKDWMESKEIWVESKIRDEIQKINIRPYVEEMRIDDNEMYIRTQAIEGKMARITDILDSLKFTEENNRPSFVIQRIGQFVEKDGRVYTPFDMV